MRVAETNGQLAAIPGDEASWDEEMKRGLGTSIEPEE